MLQNIDDSDSGGGGEIDEEDCVGSGSDSDSEHHSGYFLLMEKIAKDVNDIQSRLLDHRPVITAEIRFFVREFEEKRGLR
uniref:Biogenesis of lysosome-related organelles complex 1 subunit 5 n=1 Tax=Cyprinodon variegatus TaxID=28743 RepID=A0A3Q2FCI9_CYPVA